MIFDIIGMVTPQGITQRKKKKESQNCKLVIIYNGKSDIEMLKQNMAKQDVLRTVRGDMIHNIQRLVSFGLEQARYVIETHVFHVYQLKRDMILV